MKVGSTLFEARMVAAPTDIRFVLPLGTTDLHSCPPSPPPPSLLRDSREPTLKITASKDQ